MIFSNIKNYDAIATTGQNLGRVRDAVEKKERLHLHGD